MITRDEAKDYIKSYPEGYFKPAFKTAYKLIPCDTEFIFYGMSI